MIERHRAAIRRNKLSRPVTLLIEKGLLDRQCKFFDFGCGHGQDLEILQQNGFIDIAGYDPYYRPKRTFTKSDVVNLGYVINVIEDPNERSKVLKQAFSLAKKALCVSTMLVRQKNYKGESFSDGVKTKTKTFQKYYEQAELKKYIESTLKHEAIALSQGIFLVFKGKNYQFEYLRKKHSRFFYVGIKEINLSTKAPKKTQVLKPKLEKLICDSPYYAQVIDFALQHGRIPVVKELVAFQKLVEEFKSKENISQIITQSIGEKKINAVKTKICNDLLISFALRIFSQGMFLKPSNIPTSTLLDIKHLFGSYQRLLRHADSLLFDIEDQEKMKNATRATQVGKILPDAIYIHSKYIKNLPPLIRLKVGIAEFLAGGSIDCNIVKINRSNDKVSFLSYEDFDSTEHPVLLSSLLVDISKAKVREWDFTTRENPPVLHRKEAFVAPDYPLYEKFKNLTKEEESHGLLGHNHIGTLLNWERFVLDKGLIIINHQVKKATRELPNRLQVTN